MIPPSSSPVVVLGAGAFGTALALLSYRALQKTVLLTKSETQAKAIREARINKQYLPNIRLPEDMEITHDFSILKTAKALIIAIPAQEIPSIVDPLKKASLPPHVPIILCSKGVIEKKPLPLLPTQFLSTGLPNPLSVLSGPNFAIEIAQNQPAASTLATHDKTLLDLLNGKMFRVYPSQDLIGVQVAGIVKNVLAIGCGMVAGKGLGANTTAAVMTRGLAEMTRLGLAMGGNIETFLGLSGMGDLTLTCSSQQSRNFRLGYRLGKNEKVETLIGSGQPLAEGYYSAGPILKLARHYHVDMPLCEAVYAVLLGSDIDTVMDELLSRPIRMEDFLQAESQTFSSKKKENCDGTLAA